MTSPLLDTTGNNIKNNDFLLIYNFSYMMSSSWIEKKQLWGCQGSSNTTWHVSHLLSASGSEGGIVLQQKINADAGPSKKSLIETQKEQYAHKFWMQYAHVLLVSTAYVT